MKKLLQYMIIRLTTRHASTAAQIHQALYNPQPPTPIIIGNTPTSPEVSPEVDGDDWLPLDTLDALPCIDVKPTEKQTIISNKKQEIIDALSYLKAKDIKSKRDKGSISMLEGVLATMV